ncbi:MAG: hypothetical protein ACOC56_03235 [Atribacterota bacterium]
MNKKAGIIGKIIGTLFLLALIFIAVVFLAVKMYPEQAEMIKDKITDEFVSGEPNEEGSESIERRFWESILSKEQIEERKDFEEVFNLSEEKRIFT